jgi:hypothetical protein
MAQTWRKLSGDKFIFNNMQHRGAKFVESIESFSTKIDDELNYLTDIRLKPLPGELQGHMVEYKSWTENSFRKLLGSDQAVSQMKAYIKSGNFEYVVDRQKLLRTIPEDKVDEFVRKQFQKVFQKNAEEWFKPYKKGGLLKDDELLNMFKTVDLDEIKAKLGDTNNDFYKGIIKIE